MSSNKKRLIRIIAAAVLLAAGMIADNVWGIPGIWRLIVFIAIYLLIGYDILWRALRNIIHGKIFDENFLMTVATLGAFAVSDYAEAAAVMLFYQVGELFQDYAVGKSRKSISDLMDIRPDKAVLLADGKEIIKDPEDINVGDIIVVKAGEKIPLDGTIVKGGGILDTSALTGESVPCECKEGDAVLSGSINLRGVLHIRAEKAFYDSTVSKIMDLVENVSDKKARAENFITRFARYYTPAVVISALLLAVIPPIFDSLWTVWITRALTFLVVSCPCALVISVPLSFFGGLGGASKEGVLFKGSAYLELIDKADVFVFDKTGTVTKGVFEVQSVYPEEKRERILKLASVAESGSNHPIAESIKKAAGVSYADDYIIEEIAGKGMVAVKGKERIAAGNSKLMEAEGVAYTECSSSGSVVYVAENGRFEGYIVISDTIKPDSARVIKTLNDMGAKTVMLTGDNRKTAAEIAEKAGISEFKAELLPSDKVAELEKIMEENKAGGAVAFIGDGINDAPVLMRADIGISMGGIGSDSAIEASDVVLMHDNLEGILKAKKISGKTLGIVKQNIIFALAVKAAVLVLSAFGLANMWWAVFADVGVAVLAILNAMRAIKIK